MTNSNELTDRKAQLSAVKQALLARRLQGDTGPTPAPTGITKRPLATPAPLSYTQQRIWFMVQLAPDSPAYNMHEAWRVKGALDVAALEQALNQVARRQPSLRTTVAVIADEPVQRVADTISLTVAVTDLTHLPVAEREQEVRALATAEAKRPFDLKTGPLLRLSALRLDAGEWVLLLTTHHIISDEWSNDIFWRELAAFYEQAQSGTAVSLPELPIEYTDFTRWQRDQLESGVLDRQLAYWRQQLADEAPLLQLATDRPRPAQQSFRGAFVTRNLPHDLLPALQQIAQAAGATLYMTLLAAFQLLLHRYSHQENILVGTPVANRQRPETKEVMGMFINTLVMRADFDDSLTFRELLAQVRERALAAYTHQDLPFERLVQALQPDRDLSYNPLFQTMFVYQSASVVRALPGLTFDPLPVDSGAAKFDLTLFAGVENGRLTTALEYSTDLFDPESAERMLRHWQTLLQAIAAAPDKAVTELPLLTEAERHQLLVTWNDTAVAFPHQQCLHDFVADHAAQRPQAAAVIAYDRRLTYAELDSYANQLAHRLVQQGIKPGMPVGLYVERSAAMLVGIVGILKAGGAYVPLDPAYPADRIAFVLDDSQAKLIVAQAHLAATLPPASADVLVLDADFDHLAGMPTEAPPTAVALDDLAYIIYTSGSTGTPKGVMVTHHNLMASTLARLHYYDVPVGRYLLLSSFAFDSSVAGIFWALAQGGTLVLPAPDEEKDVPALASLIAREQVTHTLALPSLYRLLLRYAPSGSLDSLRLVIVAGEACPPDLSADHYGRLPGAALYNEYGPTEATVWCSVYRLPAAADGRSVPIGRPIANSQLVILDSHRRPTPIGVPGELYVGGAGVTPGYLNRPELTAERFVPLLLDGMSHSVNGEQAEPATFYRTGDLARWRADGQIEFLGRVDNQVKIRGFRIEMGEIETILAEHPAVREAVVLAVEPAPAAGAALSEEQLTTALLAGLLQLEADAAERLLTVVENS
jgi:amino acid adenylation domain-containing protein